MVRKAPEASRVILVGAVFDKELVIRPVDCTPNFSQNRPITLGHARILALEKDCPESAKCNHHPPIYLAPNIRKFQDFYRYGLSRTAAQGHHL